MHLEEKHLTRNKLFLENTNRNLTGEKVQKKRKNLRINQQLFLFVQLFFYMLSNLPQLHPAETTRNEKFMA